MSEDVLKEVNEIPSRERKSIYKKIVKQFLESNMKVAEVDIDKLIEDGKTKANNILGLYNSFKWAIETSEAKFKVKVIRRRGKIYLMKVGE
jgi:hypothetical protein